MFLPWDNSEDTHICSSKEGSFTNTGYQTEDSAFTGPGLERQQQEYSCIVSDANLQLPHLKAEAIFGTKTNSVIEVLHSA